jgi:subfamily B ATP-binding cassette protein MsbA
MLSIVGFDIISPWPFKILIDNVLSTEHLDTSGPFAFLHTLFPSRDLLGFFAVFLYFLSTFALTILEYIRSAFAKRVIKNLVATFSKEAFKNLQTLAIGFYSKQKIGDYIYRLGYDVSALGEFLEEGILPLFASSLYLIVTVGIMFWIDVRLTLLSLSAVPFLALGLYTFNSRVGRATKHSEFLNSMTFSFIEETLKHLKIIQAFSQERKKTQAFDRHIETSLFSDVIVYKLDFLISLVVGIVIAVSYSLVMLYGIQLVFSGTLTTGLLIVFIFYLDNLTNPLLSLIYAATTIRQSYAKISRMEEFFSAKSHLDYHKGKVTAIAKADIRFEHVTIRGNGGKKILSNVSFTIEAGKSTAIFGVSGSGKTSLINLIMRFIEKPTSGRILLGGVPIEEYDIDTLRDAISYVPQEITLFNDSIRHNIVFGNRHHDKARLQRAAKRASAEEFIRKLPGGYNFKVGEAGGLLSGGQRQRVMLARAFMKEEAQILIFDETFSALDVKTRREVLHTVHDFSADKTTILISNVFDVIVAAENIIVLNHGKILYSGPAHRLPKEISLYKMIAEDEPEPLQE